MSRLLDLSPDQLTAEQTKIFEQLVAGRGRILGPYKVWIHSPTVASGMEQIGTYLNKRSTLSEREVEMVIMMIAHALARRLRADRACADGQEGRAVTGDDRRARRRHASRSSPTRTSRRCTGSPPRMIAGRKMPDAEFAEIEKALGRHGIAEVLVLIGYYTSVAMAMKVHEVPIPPALTSH